jgi:hypothetical protein
MAQAIAAIALNGSKSCSRDSEAAALYEKLNQDLAAG